MGEGRLVCMPRNHADGRRWSTGASDQDWTAVAHASLDHTRVWASERTHEVDVVGLRGQEPDREVVEWLAR